MRHIQEAGIGDYVVPVSNVAAHHDLVSIERLRQLDRAGTRWLKSLWQAEVIESVHAIGTAHWREAYRAKSTAEQFSGGLANPLQTQLAGAVVEWENQQNAPAIGCGSAGCGAVGGYLRLRINACA
jgi:hypothetical protein